MRLECTRLPYKIYNGLSFVLGASILGRRRNIKADMYLLFHFGFVDGFEGSRENYLCVVMRFLIFRSLRVSITVRDSSHVSAYPLSKATGDLNRLGLEAFVQFSVCHFSNFAIIFRRTWKRDSQIISLIGVIFNFNCIQRFTIFSIIIVERKNKIL